MKPASYIFILIICSCELANEQQNVILSDLNELSEKSNPTQLFEINNNLDTVLTGNAGTSIYIPANSLTFENGQRVNDKIQIKLKEIYSASEMILNQLATMSDGNLLESSGMIRLEAFSDTQKLHLKLDSPLKIKFKKTSSQPLMRTYLGDVDSLGINWKLDEDNIYDTIKYEKVLEYVMELSFERDSVATTVIKYGVVLDDTIELQRINFDGDYALVEYEYAYDSLYYPLYSTKLGWINCDFFVYSEDNINAKIKEFDQGSTVNFLLFKEFNSLMVSWKSEDNKTIFENIPKSSKVIAISIANHNGAYYFGSKEQILNDSDQEISIEYEQLSLDELGKRLRSLDVNIISFQQMAE
ncbi:MAG: hypothetical protein AAGA66_00550 [Bacteroidota bacterium]